MAAKNPDYDAMSIDELKAVIAAAQAALDAKVEARRQELLAELASLGGAPVKAQRKPKEVQEGDARLTVKPMYRTPDGSFEWSGRGAIPKAFKALGVTDRSQMDAYKIQA